MKPIDVLTNYENTKKQIRMMDEKKRRAFLKDFKMFMEEEFKEENFDLEESLNYLARFLHDIGPTESEKLVQDLIDKDYINEYLGASRDIYNMLSEYCHNGLTWVHIPSYEDVSSYVCRNGEFELLSGGTRRFTFKSTKKNCEHTIGLMNNKNNISIVSTDENEETNKIKSLIQSLLESKFETRLLIATGLIKVEKIVLSLFK